MATIPRLKQAGRRVAHWLSLLALIGTSVNAQAVNVYVTGGDLSGPLATEEIFANGDLTGTVDRPSTLISREWSAEYIVNNYDVIVIPYNATAPDWNTVLLPFLASGGGIIREGYITGGNNDTLITQQFGVRYTCPDGSVCYLPNTPTSGPSPLIVSTVAGLTDGLTADFTPTLGYFGSWNAALSPFVQADALGLGIVTYALQGQYSSGRVVFTQMAPDKYATSTGTPQEINSYNFLKNAIQWTASSTVAPDPNLRFVPAVEGLAEADAIAALNARGLVLGNRWLNQSNWFAPGSVQVQTPSAGAGAFVGDAVDFVVVDTPNGAPVVVPDVRGLTYAEADAVLANVNLGRECCISGYSSTVPAGQFITQYPRAGEITAEGWVVTPVMSDGQLVGGVPAVKLMTQAEAEVEIVASGFVVGTVSFQNHPVIAAGYVIDQMPYYGTAAAGSAMDIVVSAGPAGTVLVTVPGVVGQAQADAEAAVTAAGLTVSVTTAASDTVAAGIVISQNPAGGSEAAEGSVVTIVVSSGPAPVVITVPAVVGLAQADAEAAIVAAGLTVGTVSSASSATVAAGNVISQTPSAGSGVGEGAAVDLVVSTGPAIVTVPGVVGQTQTAAQTAIVAAGLTVGVVTTASSNTVTAGSVISQSPAGGVSVTEGTPVDLVVSSGPALVVVPNVVGATYASAIATITNAGLTVGSVSTITTRRSCGVVNSQTPTGGTSVQPGSAVNLVVTRTRTCNPL